MDLKFEVVVVPVSDVDRAKKFYEEALGFRVNMQMPGAAFLKAPGGSNDHDLGLFDDVDEARCGSLRVLRRRPGA